MRRGPKGTTTEHKKAAGTLRHDRKVVSLYAAPAGGVAGGDKPPEVPPPAQLTPEAARVWVAKVARFVKRGQDISGDLDTLAEYCELQAWIQQTRKLNAALEADVRRAMASGDEDTLKQALASHKMFHVPISMAAYNTLRLFAAEFLETPSSRKVTLAKESAKAKNPFLAGIHGVRT